MTSAVFYYCYILSFIYFKSCVRIIHYSFFVVFIVLRYVELSSAFNSRILFLYPRHIFQTVVKLREKRGSFRYQSRHLYRHVRETDH
jgi:hypothetical protein